LIIGEVFQAVLLHLNEGMDNIARDRVTRYQDKRTISTLIIRGQAIRSPMEPVV